LKGIVQSLYDDLDISLPLSGRDNNRQPRKSLKSKQEVIDRLANSAAAQVHQLLDMEKKKASTPASKRKNIKTSNDHEMLYVQDLQSFIQRVTFNTKCLQISLFLIDLIFAPFFH
jgi:DNA topoisomerase VI subunit A